MARILVADDEAGVRLLVARALGLEGHQVETAEDGEEALAILASRGDCFDLLLSDIRMPAMDGIELARAAAADFPDLTILLMTGYAEQRERAADLAKIIFDVVEKPFSIAEIRRAVAQALQSRTASAFTTLRRYG